MQWIHIVTDLILALAHLIDAIARLYSSLSGVFF